MKQHKTTGYIAIAIIALVLLSCSRQSPIAIVQEMGQDGYFPSDGEYSVLGELCDEEICFTAVAVDYVSETMKGMRRIAILDSDGTYLGCYSGFDELPINVRGNTMYFPKSDSGDTAVFDKGHPPSTIWIDGQNYQFDKAL